MQQFTIYSIGDSAFLEQILISVAMLFNTSEIKTAAIIVGMIAVLLTGFSSIANKGKEFDVSTILVGIILFVGFFVPKTTILIEDTVTGEIRVVDNVPLAIGASGGIISQLGYGVGELFEQGYSLTGTSLSSGYFAESLVILGNLRKSAYNNHVLSAIEKDTGTHLLKDIETYVKECLSPAMQIKGLNYSHVGSMNIFKLFEEGSISANTHGTVITTNLNGSEQNVTCAEAHQSLRTKLTSAVNSGPNTRKALANATGALSTALNYGESTYGDTESRALAAISDSFAALNVSSISSQDYIMAIILEDSLLKGVDSYYTSVQDYNHGLMLNQAIEQRNTQWATEQSLFLSTVRPLQAFFESLVYAIAPFIAVLLLAGKIGYGIASKYLLSLIWVQLWFPMLSIVNMFIYMGAAKQFSQFSSAEGADLLLSQYGLNTANQIAQSWVATGGMLAGATPMIALFLVTGSVYTMNSIAGRMSGSGHIDPKIASPDFRNSPAAMQVSSLFSGDERGVQKTAFQNDNSKFSFTTDHSQSVAHDKGISEASQVAFADALSTGFERAASDGRGTSYTSSLGGNLSASRNEKVQAVMKNVESWAESRGLSKQATNQLMGAAGLTISAGLQAKAEAGVGGKAGLSEGWAVDTIGNVITAGAVDPELEVSATAGASAGVSVGVGSEGRNIKSTSFMDSLSDEEKKSFQKSVDEAITDDAGISYALAHSIVNGENTSQSESEAFKQGGSLSKSASQVLSSQNSLRESEQKNTRSGVSMTVDQMTFGSDLNNFQHLASGIRQSFTPEENQSIKERENFLMSQRGMTASMAQNVAFGEHVSRTRPEAFNQLGTAMYDHAPATSVNNSHLSDKNVNTGNLEDKFNTQMEKGLPEYVPPIHNKKPQEVLNPYSNQGSQVRGAFSEGRDYVNHRSSSNAIGMLANNSRSAIEQFNNNPLPSLSKVGELMGSMDKLVNDFKGNPNASTGYALMKGFVENTNLPGKMASSAFNSMGLTEQMDKGISMMKQNSDELLGHGITRKMVDSIGNMFSNVTGNQQGMIDFGKNNLGLNDTQAQYFAAKHGNFTNIDPHTSRESVKKEAYQNAMSVSNGDWSDEKKEAFASDYANNVVKIIDHASNYGNFGGIISSGISNLNNNFNKINEHNKFIEQLGDIPDSVSSGIITNYSSDNSGEKKNLTGINAYSGGNIGSFNAMESQALADTLISRESGGKLDATNSFGYVGLYQFGARALAQTGFIDMDKFNAASAGVKNGSNAKEHKEFLANDDNWIKGSLSEYKQNRAMQDESFEKLTEFHLGIGQNVHKGDKQKMMGYAMAAHLTGPGGANNYYNNGKDNPDGYGTKTSSYAKAGENLYKSLNG